LLIILPTAILPLVIVISFSSIRIYNHLESQGRNFYFTLLSQVKKNIDFIYGQYGRTLTNMMNISSVKSGLNILQFNSKEEELSVKKSVMGDATTEGGFRNTAEEKIDGNVIIYELDKKSLIDNKDYTIHILNSQMGVPDLDKLLVDPLFLKVKKNNKIKMVFGKFQKGVINMSGGDDLPIIIFPYYQKPPENENDTFTKFVVVVLNSDFVDIFYKDIDALKLGTLYILDADNNIIARNHPSSDDELEFDYEKNQYIQTVEEKNSQFMSFNDYKMLNINPDILNHPAVKNFLEELTPEGYNQILSEIGEGSTIFEKKNYISFGGKNFLTIVQYGEQTETKFIFFYPINQIQKPIFDIINIILIMTVIVIIMIILISFLFSKTFTNPIQVLVEATKIIAQGDYNHFTNVNSTDEIGDLSHNFNQMIKNIKLYQDKLLSAEREKSELELASRIQTCLLPAIPEKEFYDITATMIPAAEVGGDYYDLIGEKDGRIWFGIGDVSGHGLTSGLIMMMAQTAFNTILLNDPEISSSELISQVNRVMYQNIKQRLGEDHFMTLSFMVANPDGIVKYSGAHLDVMIYRKQTRKVERIETKGIWLGLIPDIKDKTIENEFRLNSGDLMFLFTDGLIEATNKDNEQYDVSRLIKKLEESGDQPIKDLEESIIDDVFSFLDVQKDDITFVIARKK
jgi:serine phosphatase RsbU (regulator of sigma subunit)